MDSSAGSKTIGSDPPSGLACRVGGFPHIFCPMSLRGNTRTVPNLSPSKTHFKLCSKHSNLYRKIQSTVVFSNPQMPDYVKNHSRKFHLSASVFYPTWRLSAPAIRLDLTEFLKKTQLTLKPTTSFIYNSSQNCFSLMVQKHRKESLQRLSPLNDFHLSTSRQQLSIYGWAMNYVFGSETCLLFRRIFFKYYLIRFHRYKQYLT